MLRQPRETVILCLLFHPWRIEPRASSAGYGIGAQSQALHNPPPPRIMPAFSAGCGKSARSGEEKKRAE